MRRNTIIVSKRIRREHRQLPEKGSVLLVSLIFLLVLTLMGLSAASMFTADERIARNKRDYSVAMQAAEAALRDARNDILITRAIVGATGATSNCKSTKPAELKGLCFAAANGDDQVWDLYLEHPDHSIAYGEITNIPAARRFSIGTGSGQVSAQPRYIVEAIPDSTVTSLIFPGVHWAYRITAIGYGARPDTRVTLQEVIRK